MRISLKDGCVEKCPGCAHKWLKDTESRSQKEQWLKKKLSPWADKFVPIQFVAPEKRWRYRQKVCLSASWDSTGWKMGLVSDEKVVPIHDCPVHAAQVCGSIALLSRHLPPRPAFPLLYYVQSGAQVTLVLKSKIMPDLSWLDHSLEKKLNGTGIHGLWLHLHPCAGRNVFAKNTWHLIYGSPRSKTDDGLIYGPKSFQQLIPTLSGHALNAAEQFLNPEAGDTLIDLYCGIGIGLKRWSQKGCRVIGVERDGEAVECATKNAPESIVLRGKCKDRIPQLLEWQKSSSGTNGQRLLYVNPPRTGLEPEITDWVTNTGKPDRLAYLSCSAGTLKRDLERLTATGNAIVSITPYDFFPQTHHVETQVFLQTTDQ